MRHREKKRQVMQRVLTTTQRDERTPKKFSTKNVQNTGFEVSDEERDNHEPRAHLVGESMLFTSRNSNHYLVCTEVTTNMETCDSSRLDPAWRENSHVTPIGDPGQSPRLGPLRSTNSKEAFPLGEADI